MSANSNWKRDLAQIVQCNNYKHALRDKTVSHLTRKARSDGIFRSFAILRQLGFKLRPEGLGERHIAWLMLYWIGDPKIASLPAGRREKETPRQRPYSPAYIQQQLSFLRVFAAWIGKPGMVRSASCYVDKPALVQRSANAKFDRSWSAQVSTEEVIARVAERDPRVAVQLEMLLAFGLRRKEAIMFCPHISEVPLSALPVALHGNETYLSFLRIKRGTKGGRLRFTPVRTEFQKAALDKARKYVHPHNGHLGQPGFSLKQSLIRFTNTVRVCGVTKAILGVTPHGLRHQFAGDLFFDLTSVPAPVRGGAGQLDAATLRDAYLEVARQLGHNRPPISGAYLGKPVPRAG